VVTPDHLRQEAAAAAGLRRAEAKMAGLCGRTPVQIGAAIASDSLTWTWSHGTCGPAPGTGPDPAAPGELRLDRAAAVTVTRADPVIWIAAAILTAVAWQIAAPELRLVAPDDPAADLAALAASGELSGRALFKVDAADAQLVYRVGRYLPVPDVYECSMPD
jgi:hypothetical protein